MYSKSLGVKILSSNKRNVRSKASIVTSILIAVILVTGLSILSHPIENVLANPCSHNSGGNGGSGSGTGNSGSESGLGSIIGNIGIGVGGPGAPGGDVNCQFNGPVTTIEPSE
jgi:uncharacterized membrane protein